MLDANISSLTNRIHLKRGLIFGLLIVTALLAFELFNYSTTDFALKDLLGDLEFLGIGWATILSIAFCGIDFAGIARLFTPEQGADEPAEVWYLFGAWMLAAVMNAMLTWWGVSIAILNHETLGNAVVARATLLKVVPIFVAVMVWLIRVLIIGTLSMAGDRLFSQSATRTSTSRNKVRLSNQQTSRTNGRQKTRVVRPAKKKSTGSTFSGFRAASSYRPSPKPKPRNQTNPEYEPLDPTYTPVSFHQTSSGYERNKRF
jgi:hypothetical protein